LDVFMRRSAEEAIRLCTPDIELTTLFDAPGNHEFSGQDGLRRWFERLDELWSFVELRGVELTDLDDGWVLIGVTARARGRGSPHEFEPRVSVAIKVVGGKIAKFGLFPNQAGAEAMIAAG
jgi:ketosteroid isomerase-like protein